MKEPNTYELRESELAPFVLAAGTPTHRTALDLLLVHAKDLAWGEDRLGLYLIEAVSLKGHEDALNLAKSRAWLGARQTARILSSAVRPHFIEWITTALGKVVKNGVAPEQAIAEMVGALTGPGKNVAVDLFRQAIPDVIGHLGYLVDGLAYFVAVEAQNRRQRQVAATGLTEQRYNDMLTALRALEVAAPFIRIALPRDRRPEITLSSAGIFESKLPSDVPAMEVLRVLTGVEELKVVNDVALQVFLSAYLNAQSLHGRHAFSCAKYMGDVKAVEVDLAIPRLKLGAEIKLYNAPNVANVQHLKTHASELAKVFVLYESIGVERFVFISNLRNSDAREVARLASDKLKHPQNAKRIKVVADSARNITDWLDETVLELHKIVGDDFFKEIHTRIERAFSTVEASREALPAEAENAGGVASAKLKRKRKSQ